MKSKVYINGETLHGESEELLIDRAEWENGELFLFLNGKQVLILGGYMQGQITFDKGFTASTKTDVDMQNDIIAVGG